LSDRRGGLLFALVVIAWGVQAIVGQSLLVREALVLMFGSELAWGVVLFAWLLGVAVGGIVGGIVAERVRAIGPVLSAALTVLSLAVCVDLYLFRGARGWLEVGPGELVSLSGSVLSAVLFISPTGALVGFAFPLACRVAAEHRKPESSEGASRNGRRSGGVSDPGRVRSADRFQRKNAVADGPQSGSYTASDEQNGPHGGPYAASETTNGCHGQAAACPCLGPPDSRASESVGAAHNGVHTSPGSGPLGRVYALESAGSLIGGAAFSFWAVDHLAPIQTALLCGAFTTLASGVWLIGRTRRLVAPGSVVVVGIALAAICVWQGARLDRNLIDRRWKDLAPGYELVAEAESKYQNLSVGRRAGQFSLYCDGQVTVSFPDPYDVVPLSHLWMCQHPEPRRVLVLGGGAEGLLAEILKHPVDHVDYVEPDPRQIDLVKPFIGETDRIALSDKRVTVHHVDARFFIKTRRNEFDMVIARLPEPTSALRARFYTEEFFGELRRAMTGRSVLCMTVTAAPGELSAMTGEYLGSMMATVGSHFPHVVVGWGDPAQVLAATDTGIVSIAADELMGRYTSRGIESKYFDPLWFAGATDWLDPAKVAERARELATIEHPEVSTDLRPIVYIQRLALWEWMVGGERRGVIERLRAVTWGGLIGVLLAIGAVGMAVPYLRSLLRSGARANGPRILDGAITVSVGSTGLVTMALSIVWLFAFQNLYGYVYQRIGWIIAVFMGGLVVGCFAADRWCRTVTAARRPRSVVCRRLIAVDVLLAGLCVLVPLLLPVLAEAQGGELALVLVEWVVIVMVGLTGVLGGASFALCGLVKLESMGGAGAAAGSIVGADHAGACIGALLTGVLLVPVFGTLATAVLLAAIKLASATLLLCGAWHDRSTYGQRGQSAAMCNRPE